MKWKTILAAILMLAVLAPVAHGYSINEVNWSPLPPAPTSPVYMVSIETGWEDAFATWGTATCTNDLTGQVGGGGNPTVPIPPTVWLLGSGLLGLVLVRPASAGDE
jgi:hypothetical protein